MNILIAGGGTGGHFFSGVAVGEAFLSRTDKNRVVYAGTRQGIEGRVGPVLGLPVRFIEVRGIKGKGILSRLGAVLALPRAFWQSLRLVIAERPQVVIGVGGYASGPIVLAAWLLGKKTAIVEQNSVAGFTNRILGRFVDRAFVAFPDARRHFPAHKVVVTGNPIREKVVQLLTLESTATVGIGERLRILVLGGSQGARAINEAFMAAAAIMGADLKASLAIVHQTGLPDEARVREAYTAHGIRAEVHAFIDKVAEEYRAADLVVCRAGALTVSELCISRRASVLVPFPFATDNHQEGNARLLVGAGAAELLRQSDMTGEHLLAVLDRFHRDRRRLQEMARAAGNLARPQAASDVADEMHRIAGVP